MNAYHEGIAARKADRGIHENPYRGQRPSFADWLLNPRIHRELVDDIAQWDDGWNAENNWHQLKSRSAMSAQTQG